MPFLRDPPNHAQAPSKALRPDLAKTEGRFLSDIYLFQVASQKAQWLSARQTAVASNVANASTPGYRAVDVQPFSAVLNTSPIAMTSTNPAHIAPATSLLDSLKEVETDPAEQTLSGNTVNLEQQMINLGEVSRDFSMTAGTRRAFHQLMLAALK
jgi:flagellar basal-body rod protein FlgB